MYRLHSLLFIVLVVCGFGTVSYALPGDVMPSAEEAHSDCDDCDECPDEDDCGDECSTCHCCSPPTTSSMTNTPIPGLPAPNSEFDEEPPELEGHPAAGITPGVFKPPQRDPRRI